MTWDDITVNQWIRLTKFGDKDLNDLSPMIELISIIFKMDLDEVRRLPINKAVELKREVEELFLTPMNETNLTQSFKIDDVEFSFADLQTDWILAKNIDLEHYSKNPENLHISLAILYYPKGVDYETKKALEWSKLILDEPINRLIPAMSFFFLLAMDSVKITGNYSVLTMMEESLKIAMKSLKDPEKLPRLVRRILLKKLRKSGLPLESLKEFPVVELNNGSTS